jgi:hypothetical protein
MNCFQCERNLSAYLDDELRADERDELEVHLDACETCRAEFESQQAAWEAAQATTAEAAPEALWHGIEDQLRGDGGQAGLQELNLMVKGLSADVQDLRRTVDDLRRLVERAWADEAEDDTDGRVPGERIRVRANPFRPGVPREASIDQLRRSS